MMLSDVKKREWKIGGPAQVTFSHKENYSTQDSIFLSNGKNL